MVVAGGGSGASSDVGGGGGRDACDEATSDSDDEDEDEDEEEEEEDDDDDEWPPAHVELDWSVPTADGWVWFGPMLRGDLVAAHARATPTGPYRASNGHKANHAGWRANCELVPYVHPVLGCVKAVRVLDRVGGVAAGAELTVDYAHLVGAPEGRRPRWLMRLLEQRTEEGYYAHLRFTPPRTIYSAPAGCRAHGRLKVVAHGPWRVLWFDGVEQGMTCHDEAGKLRPAIVGFDYQRTMVAATVALAALGGASGTVDATRRGAKAALGVEAAPGVEAEHGVEAEGCARGRGRVLLVGLGAGSCVAAVEALLGRRGVDVEVVDNDARVMHAAETAHGLHFDRSSPGEASCVPGRARGKDRGHRPQEGGVVRAVLSDAAEHVATLPVGSLSCVLLDAYDAKGCVPAHLQAAPFLRALGHALAPGGIAIANLWNGTAERRAEADAFVATLVRTVGVQPFALRVVGHEKNRILVAVKGGGAQVGGGRTTEALGAALRRAAEEHAAAGTEPALVETMRSNVETLRPWG